MSRWNRPLGYQKSQVRQPYAALGFKKGDKTLTSNYRPVSFSSNVGKPMESVIAKNIIGTSRQTQLNKSLSL